MVTVGYGDVYPSSYLGRTVVVLGAFWGACTLSMVVVELDKQLRLTKREYAVYSIVELSKPAAKCVSLAFKY